MMRHSGNLGKCERMTKRWFMLATLIMAASATAAHAETRTLSSSGLWSTYGGSDDQQRRVCGVVTVGADGRRIDIAQYAIDGGIDLSLQKENWAIPGNTEIPLQVQFDRDSAVPSRGVGDGRRVVAHLSFEQSVPFMRALRNGIQIRIYFPGGNEPVWTGGLSGSGRAIDAFNECRASLVSSNPTQPFSNTPQPATAPIQSAPTQPFSAQPAQQPAPSFQNGLPPLPPPT